MSVGKHLCHNADLHGISQKDTPLECLPIGVLTGLYIIHTRRPSRLFLSKIRNHFFLKLKVNISGISCRSEGYPFRT